MTDEETHKQNLYMAAVSTQAWFRPVDPEEFWDKVTLVQHKGLDLGPVVGCVLAAYTKTNGEMYCTVQSKDGRLWTFRADLLEILSA